MKQHGSHARVDVTSLPALPEGWCWTTVAALGTPGEQTVLTGPFGSTLGRKDFVPAGIPLLTIGCLTEQGITLDKAFYISEAKAHSLERYRVGCGDLLFSRSASVGRAGLVTANHARSVINYHLMRLRLTPVAIRPLFFIYFAKGSQVVLDYLRAVNHGATRDGINTNDLLGMPVSLPPLNEQRRIVAKIEELFSDLDAGVAALKRVQANLKRYRAAVLKAAVEGRLTAAWREKNRPSETGPKLLARILAERRRKWEQDQLAAFAKAGKTPPAKWKDKYKQPAPPDSANLPSLPKGWCWATCEQLGQVQLGRQRSPKNRSKDYPTRYIRAANITEGGLDVSDLLDMEFTPRERDTYRLHVGDIVLSEASGSPDQVGKPAVWTGEVPECCFQNTVIRLRAFSVESGYLLAVFLHCYWNKVFAKVAGGVGINHLSAAKFARLAIPVPPLCEQQQIAAEVDRRRSIMKAAENEVTMAGMRSTRLRQAILKRAFEGDLVPQDPTDEPASKLLAGITAQPKDGGARTKAPTRTRSTRKKTRGKEEPSCRKSS